MNKRGFFNIVAVTVVALVLSGCAEKKFHITGTITEAEDSVLYLENMSLDGPVTTDSVRLGADGAFSFAGKVAPAPEFYRLRISRRIINISIDSTETVSVTASYPTMASGYVVEGSDNCSMIKELVLKQMDLQRRVIAVNGNYDIPAAVGRDSIDAMVEAYKEDIRTNYIFKEPMKSYSYFALFQAIGGQLVFNPRENRDDIKAFAAVATSWDVLYPGSKRGQNLHNIAIEGMKTMRIVDNNRNAAIDASKVNLTNIIDISLADNKGVVRSLSDLKGKVVLLDFHLFNTTESKARIMQLRELYNKYHSQGFEIYQVSLDGSEHFWKQQTAALPWVCVRDPEGVSSGNVMRYNVQAVPTFFLIDRSNSLHKRDTQIEDIDAEIRALL